MNRIALGVMVVTAASIARGEPQPATHETTTFVPDGWIALGVGESLVRGIVRGNLHHATLSARVTSRDWISVTYGHRGGDLKADTNVTMDLPTFYELGAAASRMFCTNREPVCMVVGAGLGYQRAVYSEINDLPNLGGPPIFFHDHSALHVEGRFALRLAFPHVWVETGFALRHHTPLEADGDVLGHVLGIAVHVVR